MIFQPHHDVLTDHLYLEEILLSLESNLTPKQTAAFLLLDVFYFSAEEVAGIVKSTPGVVYSAVQRARKKIESLDFSKSENYTEANFAQKQTIEAYLQAFNEGNLDKMLNLYSDYAQHEAFLGFQGYSKDEMRNGSLIYGLPGHKAVERTLWGKPLIVVLAVTKEGL